MAIQAVIIAYFLLGMGVALAVFKSERTGFMVFIMFMLCVVIWPVLFMSVVTAALIAVATSEPQKATVRTELASTTKAEEVASNENGEGDLGEQHNAANNNQQPAVRGGRSRYGLD